MSDTHNVLALTFVQCSILEKEKADRFSLENPRQDSLRSLAWAEAPTIECSDRKGQRLVVSQRISESLKC